VGPLTEYPDFLRMPPDVATCMYHTGIDPFTKQQVYIAKGLRDRKVQRGLMQFFKPANYFEVRKALEAAGRADLIGTGCDALIGAHAPKEALEARRNKANQAMRSDHVHTIPDRSDDEPNRGYRPKRKTASRQHRH
jgi:hypothetical protein